MEKHPNNMFSGNMITQDEFVGKFAEEPGEDWLELNSYDETIVEIPDQGIKEVDYLLGLIRIRMENFQI